jgi:DNA-binding transcriptional LysR family regulator
MQLAPEIVATSDLVVVLPQDMMATSPFLDRLTTFTPPVAIDPVTFHLLWHPCSHDHPAQRWFCDTIVATAA